MSMSLKQYMLSMAWNELQQDVGLSALSQGKMSRCEEDSYRVERKRSHLIHIISEISSASESLCQKDDPELRPEFSQEELKLADSVLRIMEYSEFFGLDLVGAILSQSKKLTNVEG